MEKKRRHKKVEFIMDTDWLFQGILDAEQKQYVLLNYFQKLNKHLERMELINSIKGQYEVNSDETESD